MHAGRVSSASPAPALALSSFTKRFGGVAALNDVSLTVERGEIRGLLGENGSGKSTLIKILAGYHIPDSGTLQVYGRDIALPAHARQLKAAGLTFVHQDLGLVPSLTVVENLRISLLAAPTNGLHISWRNERTQARALFKQWGLDLDPGARVSNLRPIERALLALVRAVEQFQARAPGNRDEAEGVLILDEPTVFLPRAEVDDLFALIRVLADRGATVVFVSHDLSEVKALTHRITVLRDGVVVGTADTDETSEGALIQMIVGREVKPTTRRSKQAARSVARMSVQGLTGGLARELEFDFRAGEVLGLTGIAGSGFEDVPYLLFGAVPASAGRLRLEGDVLNVASISPARARKLGLALIPSDRQRQGAVPGLSLVDNVGSLVLREHFKRGILRRRKLEADVHSLLQRFRVRPADPRMVYSALSGGNQQRALLAKWLQTKPRVLLLHEPTQGVDVGARSEIFELIRAAARDGAVVICASTDHEQLAAVSDRIIVFAQGRVSTELVEPSFVAEQITQACFNAASSMRVVR